MANNQITSEPSTGLSMFELLIGLSVDLHNLNAGVQRRFSISIVQWLVLKKIVELPGLSASTLAEHCGVHPSTLTSTISRLEAMGLIFIQERSNDQRRRLLLASRLGFDCCRKSASAFNTAMLSSGQLTVSADDVANIRGLAKLLIQNVNSATASLTE